MLWVIQENIYTENRRHDLIQALERLNIPFIIVKVSNNTMAPDIPIDNTLPIITNGSIMLSNIALKRNWNPGSLLNDNFSYKVWAEQYRGMLLNKTAIVCSLADAKISSPKFIRPILDNKSFDGRVFSVQEFLELQKNSSNSRLGAPKSDTEILISNPKSIGQEHRHYIVDGEVVTSSRYKLSGQPNFQEGCDEKVLEVVKRAINLWTPARAFVLDTYISGEEIGIVEIGCICHAGLYKADVMKLVNALDSMEFKMHLTQKSIKPNF